MMEKPKKRKFLGTDFNKYSKLGVRRRKKQKYRKGKGIDNKLRLKKKGRLRNINIGFRNEKKSRDLINGLKPVMIYNLNDLKDIKSGEIGILAKIGNKKKKEIAEYSVKNKIRLKNFNPEEFLKKIEAEIKNKKEKKEFKKGKKKERDKKSKEKEKKAEQEKKEEKSESADNPIKGEQSENKQEEVKQNEPAENSKATSEQPEETIEKNKKENKKQIQTNNYGRGKWS